MSNSGQRPLYPWRVYKPQRGSRPPTGHVAQQPSHAQRTHMQSPSAARQSHAQQLAQPLYAYAPERSTNRATDLPSATFSRANRDRGLSNVFASNPADNYRRPQSHAAAYRMPQSSAGYQDIPAAMSQDMSISEASTGAFYQDRPSAAYDGHMNDQVPRAFLEQKIPNSISRSRPQGQRDPVGTAAPPALHVKFRRIADALAEVGISFPARSTQLSCDHAIQAFAHFYGLFLPMPPDFPQLDFTIAGAHQATRLKRGIDAVNGLLEDLGYDDRRQTIAEMANLSLIEHPHRTVSAMFWLMELAEQAHLAVLQDEEDEVPSMDQSLEYAEYAVRMVFASSLSNTPESTVPEARAYIDAALSRFRTDKEDAIGKHKAEIKAFEEKQAEETQVLEADILKLTRLETRATALENRKRELSSNLESVKSSFTSLKTELDNRQVELVQSKEDFEAMKAKLVVSGIDSPQRALELAIQLQSQQEELDRLDIQLESATAQLLSEHEEPVTRLLDDITALACGYNEGVPETLLFPALPNDVGELLGKSASDFMAAQKMLSMSEDWKRSAKEAELQTSQFKRLIDDTEAKISDLEKAIAGQSDEAVKLRVIVEQLSSESDDAQREAHQLQRQLQTREEQIHGRRPQGSIPEKQELQRELLVRVTAAEAKNADLESQMRKCADRKREIRVLLETYKAAYARIVEGIGQRESVIRQQETTVNHLQRVLNDFAPPTSGKPTRRG